jgi:DGQHR domain-containing protein
MSDFLASKPHPDPTPFEHTFACTIIQQPVGELYSGVIPHDLLVTICDFDVRRVLYEERDVERYLGIQRPLSKARVKEIGEYVNFSDATFPSAIIIAVDERCVQVNSQRGTMTLRNVMDPESPVPKRMIARVIDGQHRVAGLRWFKPTEQKPKFDCMVTVLVGMDIADQAHIFATVNLAQAKVNRSLAIDLYALEKTRSPMKTAHSVVVALDRNQGGPFYRRIKRLGVATEGRAGETLSQATVVDGLMPYISTNPDYDRDQLLRGRKLPRVESGSERTLLFRNWFLDEKDGLIARSYSAFFDAVRQRWPGAWESPQPGEILCRTTGYKALSKLFGDVYFDLGGSETEIRADQVLALLRRSDLTDREFSAERFLPGSSGQSLLYRTLRDQIFGP